MYQDKLHLVEHNIYSYLVVDRHTFQLLDSNNLARSYYSVDGVFPPLNELFQIGDGTVPLKEKVQKGLTFCLGSIHLDNVISSKSSGEKVYCELECCLIDKEGDILFCVVREKEKDRDAQMTALVELDDNAVFVLKDDDIYTVTYGNDRFYQYICMTPEEFLQENQASFVQLLQEEHRVEFQKTVKDSLRESEDCDKDLELTFDGKYFQLFRFNVHKTMLPDGSIALMGVLVSVKKQSDLMKKIEYDQQYFDIMQEFSKDLLFRIDVKTKTLVHRGDISKYVGLQPEMDNFPECMRENRLIHPEDLEAYIAFAYRLMHGMEATCEPRFQFISGTFDKYRLQGKPLFNAEGEPVQVVGKSENIQKYVDIEARANYDTLTTTLNKQSFRELVENILVRALEKDRFALLFLDFDDFKGVNDRLGHVFGDFLLETAGKRILNSVRSHDKVGRVGGDEFVIFFQHAPTDEAVLERAESVLASLRRSFNNGDISYTIRASIGISLFPEHGKNYDELYHNADRALYESKALGKDVATIYKPRVSES